MKIMSLPSTLISASYSFKTVKNSLVLVLAVGFLAACGSNPTQDDEPFDDGSVEEATTAVATAIDDSTPEVESTEPVVEAVELDNVFYFEFDESTLTSDTRAALDTQAAALRGNGSAVRLEGHADERGSREYNLALAERRANSIADYLAIQGVSRSRIEVVSYGEERPVSLRSDESAYSMNRRVELK